jgi:Putative peptidoglycan binding domain
MPAAAPATVSLLPRPRPAEADATPPSEPHLAEPKPSELRSTEFRLNDPKNSEKSAEKNSDPLGNLVKATVSPLSPTPIAPPPLANVPRPPASIPMAQLTGAHRVAAVQRALAAYGYGQLQPTGTLGPETRAAIEHFEHERKMPVTGQISDRLVRELSAVIGHPVD